MKGNNLIFFVKHHQVFYHRLFSGRHITSDVLTVSEPIIARIENSTKMSLSLGSANAASIEWSLNDVFLENILQCNKIPFFLVYLHKLDINKQYWQKACTKRQRNKCSVCTRRNTHEMSTYKQNFKVPYVCKRSLKTRRYHWFIVFLDNIVVKTIRFK